MSLYVFYGSGHSLKKGGEAYDDYMKTAEKTKEKNMRVMENLGVIPKKG